MNQIHMATILTRKRREKGITQEGLAEAMGVSKAAVSKWEKEQSYPDITLLPQLATYFNISVDELLGYSPQLTRDDIRTLCKTVSAEFISNPFDGWMAKCREVIKEYYSCFPLLYHMALLLVNHHCSAGTREEREEMLEEAKALCARIASESGDALLSRDAVYVQSLCCLILRAPEGVFALLGESLRRMPDLAEDNLISQAYELAGNTAKAKEISQCGMYQYLMLLIGATTTYISLSGDEFDAAQTAHHRAAELIRLYGFDKLDPNATATAYLVGANLYCEHGHLEKALELLEKYAGLCVSMAFPFKLQGDSFFTAIDAWLDDGEIGSLLPYDEKMIKQRMLESLGEFPSFAALHDSPRYKTIIRKITGFANAESI